MSSRARRFDLPTVVVIGDSVKDFCLYHALYWQHGRAIWLPSWFTSEDDSHSNRLMTAIREAESNGRLEHNKRLSFVSHSADRPVLEELKQRITGHMYRTTITIDEIMPETVAWWLEYPSRVYADGNLGDVTTHLLSKTMFQAPLTHPYHESSIR